MELLNKAEFTDLDQMTVQGPNPNLNYPTGNWRLAAEDLSGVDETNPVNKL